MKSIIYYLWNMSLSQFLWSAGTIIAIWLGFMIWIVVQIWRDKW